VRGSWLLSATLDSTSPSSTFPPQFLLRTVTPVEENVYTGKKGGPVADLAKLIGTVVGVERAPIEFSIVQGQGHIKIGSAVTAEVESLKSATGAPTVLSDAVFSVIPGSPAFVGKSKSYKFNSPALGVNKDLSGHSSVQGAFVFDA
jgi:hypothetical protein